MFEIALLIEADAYWKLVQDHIVRGDGPTAAQPKLGYLLSGPLPQTHRVQPHALNGITSRPPTPSFINTGQSITESLTPLHSTSGRRLTTQLYTIYHIPHHVIEAMTKRTMPLRKRSRWGHEYKTSLHKLRCVSSQSQQTIKVSDVIEVHGECPRLRRRLTGVEPLSPGNDCQIRATNIRTDGGRTNRSITKLYPLDAGEDEVKH